MSALVKTERGDDIRRRTETAQNTAADPSTSAWVNANAGTGKTHVLTLRVLRLLLSGTEPQRILCLTYTKAAAAEMSKRVFDRLAQWVTADDAGLTTDLRSVVQAEPSEEMKQFARTLFAQAIETPGGLKVQTVHAFCERLLQRFPLEAGVPPGFKILADDAARDLKTRAIDRTLSEATGAPSSPLGNALNIVVRYAGDTQFDTLVAAAIKERRWLDAASRIGLGASGNDVAGVEAYLRRSLSVRAGVSRQALERDCASVLSDDSLRRLCDALRGGTKTEQEKSDLLAQIRRDGSDESRIEILAEYFLASRDKSDEKPRDRLMTNAVADQNTRLLEIVQQAQRRFCQLRRELNALSLIEASVALYQISGCVLQHYSDARNSIGGLDFDDLILRTISLLSERDQAEWTLYKLDGGLDHILVDEAQDTNPEQWDIISSLTREFFAGTGARDVRRTVFAVGDEKQSIYSFQGAAPEKFAETGERFAALAAEAGLSWKRVPLTLSFRSVAPVLAAVDVTFRDPLRTPGLTAGATPIAHAAKRAGHGGLVEIWPTEVYDAAENADAWSPLSDATERSPANRLADRIGDMIKRWLDSEERLASENRPIRAGDILILVRKRAPFALPMIAALKRRDIAVAGSDRIALKDQIAVQDLLVLGDFLTLPEDDLALATVLKGPIFGFDDDDLLRIAQGRKKTLWSAFLDHAALPAYGQAVETLKRWRAKADFAPPFEFFSGLLDRDGVREKFLHRLGPEAADVIDEFLDLALSFDERSPPSLTQFLAEIRAGDVEAKRDMDHGRDEVRVMTVHAAKGLEAPIVFLPDTCTTASGDVSTKSLVKLTGLARPTGVPEPIVWAVKGTSRTPEVISAKAEKARGEDEERNRLLYVAMTRARDRLYVAGFDGKTKRPQDCWYDIMLDAMRPNFAEVDLGNGRRGWRLEAPQTIAADKPRKTAQIIAAGTERPAFAMKRVPAEPKLAVPLAPSRLEPYAPDADGEPAAPSKPDVAATRDGPSPLAGGSEHRFLRGTITHALLQYLPEVADEKREALATAFVAQRGAPLPPRTRSSIVRETLAVLRAPEFEALFGPASIAEVPIAAVIPRPGGRGPALDLSGQIDRLAVTESGVFIVDFKTNRPPPTELRFVAAAYLYQLAAYRLALAEIYPGKPLRAALLWTDGPRLMEIPSDILDRFTAQLWTLDVASLDAP